MAVISVASRVAEEVGCVLGEEVGYSIRFDQKLSSNTVIKYCTDGILLRETLTDPLLSNYSVIIIDEVHERSLNTDILLGLLKKIKKKRKDLRVIITSATLNADRLRDFFETNNKNIEGKNTACILSVEGRQYPVDIEYLAKPCSDYIRCAIDTVINIHKKEQRGDILVFLPGAEEIDNAISLIEDLCESDDIYFLPLYSSLPIAMQMRIFTQVHGKRKVFLLQM
jgi:ATP-dependent RNA helicase DDX35